MTKAEVVAVALSKPEVWSLVHAERRRLLDDLTKVDASAWEMPSLCAEWSVHEVLAHLVDTALTGKVAFVWSMVRTRGDFDRANEIGVRRCLHDDPQRTLAGFRRALELTRIPTAHPATRLVEAIVHGEDIRRPLGIQGDYPHAGLSESIAYQLRTAASLGGSRELAAGCRLVDADSGEGWGDGLEVTGSAIDLLLAITGRPVAAEALSGPGAARLITPLL